MDDEEMIESDLSAMLQRVNKLEAFSVEVLDSYLSGASWESAFKSFILLHAPKFRDFSSSGSDDERDHSWWPVYSEFCRTIDSVVEREVGRLGLTYSHFEAIFQEVHAQTDSAALERVAEKLSKFYDFSAFGEMMREEAIRLEEEESAGIAARARLERPKSFLRVLWDVENVPFPTAVPPEVFVEQIFHVLRSRQLLGGGGGGAIGETN